MFNFGRNHPQNEPAYNEPEYETTELEATPDFVRIGNTTIYRYGIRMVEHDVDVAIQSETGVTYRKGSKVTLDAAESFVPLMSPSGSSVIKLKTISFIGYENEAFERWLADNSEVIGVEAETMGDIHE